MDLPPHTRFFVESKDPYDRHYVRTVSGRAKMMLWEGVGRGPKGNRFYGPSQKEPHVYVHFEDAGYGSWVPVDDLHRAPSARDPKRKTFADARRDLLEYLRSQRWDVKTWGPQGALKTPHATSPNGEVRLWFKPQAVYVSYGRWHEAGHSRSLWVDIRTTSPEDVVRQAEQGSSRDPGRKRVMAGRPRRRRLLARLRRDITATDPGPKRRRRRRDESAADPRRRRKKRRDAADPARRRRKRRRDWKGNPKGHAAAARAGWKKVARKGWKPKKRSAKKRTAKRASRGRKR